MRIFVYITVVIPFIVVGSVVAWAQAPKKSPDEKTALTPEITYRQAYLEQRKTSVFHKETDKNYVDQLYLSLKLVKTYKFLHEVVIEPAVRTVRNQPGEVETVIDQGYVRTYQGKVSFTAGKKVEYEGSGYFVNPADLLNEKKDLFDPLYQREGKVFTRLGYENDLLNMGIGYIPVTQGEAKEGKTWVQLSSEILETDLRTQYTYNGEDLSTLGFSAARFFGDHFELHADSRFQQRQRSITQQDERKIFDCGVVNNLRGEDINGNSIALDPELTCLDPSVKHNQATAYSVFGTRIVFTPRRTLILEGIQNQGGLSKEEEEMYYRYVAELRDGPKGGNLSTETPERLIGRQYWFAAYQDEDTLKKTMLNISVLYNQNDRSTFGNTELKYTFSPFTNASVVHTKLMGREYTEFGEAPFSASTYLIFRGKF